VFYGAWQMFSAYSNPPSGVAQIAVRATNSSDSENDCADLITTLTGAGVGGSAN
jgi:hypothetical protein